jgi:hypothetical protein
LLDCLELNTGDFIYTKENAFTSAEVAKKCVLKISKHIRAILVLIEKWLWNIDGKSIKDMSGCW